MLKNTEIRYYQELAYKWLSGAITPEEKLLLENWYRESETLTAEVPEELAGNEAAHSQRIFAEIKKKLDIAYSVKRTFTRKRYRQMVAAAALVLAIAGGSALLHIKNTRSPQAYAAKDILPGTNGAVLHLWNGKNIVMNNINYGDAIATVYHPDKNVSDGRDCGYNVLSTPNGKQWKMLLPDGTKVFLNAGSVLRFPVSFSGKKERLVELTGEAYFDVVHNAKQPFKVKAGNEIIEDIGTVFNVSSYAGEKVKAVLVKGSIKIGNHILKPGEEAVADSAEIKIRQVDTHDATAWTEGQFSMEGTTVQELMKQLSRWYNIPVEYKGAPPAESFGGFLDRNVPLSNILNVLNANGINAQIENGKIIVSSK